MKNNNILPAIFLILLAIGFSQCKSTSETMKINDTITLTENKTPQVYFQNWIAGVRGGGSGLNLVLTKSFLKGITPIKVYFRGKIAVAEEKQLDFVAYYKGELNQLRKKDTSEISNEEENHTTNNVVPFPFELEEDEAIISYHNNGKLSYLKITKITKKESLAYPTAKPFIKSNATE